MYESRLMHTEGLDGCTWHLAWRSLNINSLAAELRCERLVSGPNPDLGGAESSGESGNTGLVGCFSFVVGVLEKGAPKSLRSLGSDGSVSLRSMLWSPKPLRGEANVARSFSGGIGGGRGGILSVSSLVGELLVLLSCTIGVIAGKAATIRVVAEKAATIGVIAGMAATVAVDRRLEQNVVCALP